MKTLNIIAILFAFLIITNSCCKKNAPCAQCPLPDGSSCPNNMINVFNNCQCPEGMVEFDNECFSTGSNGTYIGFINCGCVQKLRVTAKDPIGNSVDVAYSLTFNDTTYTSGGSGGTGTLDEFEWLFTDDYCIVNGASAYTKFKCTKLPNGKMNVNVYYYHFSPNPNPVDSCVNIILNKL